MHTTHLLWVEEEERSGGGDDIDGRVGTATEMIDRAKKGGENVGKNKGLSEN